jgi:hypothetical protein
MFHLNNIGSRIGKYSRFSLHVHNLNILSRQMLTHRSYLCHLGEFDIICAEIIRSLVGIKLTISVVEGQKTKAIKINKPAITGKLTNNA